MADFHPHAIHRWAWNDLLSNYAGPKLHDLHPQPVRRILDDNSKAQRVDEAGCG